MSNPLGPQGDPGSEPAPQFWAGPGPSATNAAPGWPAGGADRLPGRAPHVGGQGTKGRRTLHWTLGLAAAALLAGGGAIAAASLGGQSAPGGAGDRSSAGQAGVSQAALLNSALNSAGAPGPLAAAVGSTPLNGAQLGVAGAPQSTRNSPQAGAGAGGQAGPLCVRARRVARAARLGGLPRLARAARGAGARCRIGRRHRVFALFLLRGVDGQFTLQTPRGTKTLAFERGVIQSVTAGKTVVVKAADGTTWTWDLAGTTVVRDRQGKVGEDTLKTGTPVWVGGQVTQGAKDARLIVLRPPQPPSAAPSPTPRS